MLTLLIALGSFLGFIVAYHSYGRWLGSKIFALDPQAKVPSVELRDDVGDFVIRGAGARIGGSVTVGRGAYIGSGASIRESTVIGPGALIGMGSVVVDDVPPGETWAGVPARRLRQARNKSVTGD